MLKNGYQSLKMLPTNPAMEFLNSLIVEACSEHPDKHQEIMRNPFTAPSTVDRIGFFGAKFREFGRSSIEGVIIRMSFRR